MNSPAPDPAPLLDLIRDAFMEKNLRPLQSYVASHDCRACLDASGQAAHHLLQLTANSILQSHDHDHEFELKLLHILVPLYDWASDAKKPQQSGATYHIPGVAALAHSPSLLDVCIEHMNIRPDQEHLKMALRRITPQAIPFMKHVLPLVLAQNVASNQQIDFSPDSINHGIIGNTVSGIVQSSYQSNDPSDTQSLQLHADLMAVVLSCVPSNFQITEKVARFAVGNCGIEMLEVLYPHCNVPKLLQDIRLLNMTGDTALWVVSKASRADLASHVNGDGVAPTSRAKKI